MCPEKAASGASGPPPPPPRRTHASCTKLLASGIADQGTAAQYRGGDNILFSVPGKGHDSQRKLSREDYQVVIPDTHMPGMAW